MEIARKLRIQFTKELRRGHANNANLDPPIPAELSEHLDPAEPLIVEVTSRKGGRYFFTDRRVFLQLDSVVTPLCRYDDILHTHWISKSGLRGMAAEAEQSTLAKFKMENYDRLVLETSARDIVLDGLQQSYVPILNFFQWVNP
jgi:hypothetical protein